MNSHKQYFGESIPSYLPKVSIIILNWNGKRYITQCLDSVFRVRYPKDKLEIIVVDNASTDGSPEIIKKKYPNVVLIRNSKNLGYTMGNNIGIKKATGEIIILLNNDTYVDENFIIEIVKHMERPDVGIVGALLLYPSNVIQSCGCKEKFLGFWECLGAGLTLEEGKQICKDGMEVDYVSGAALAIKREALEKIGMLDSHFFAYMEDVDWCYRARKAGFKVIVASNAVVYHYESASWRKMPLRKFYLDYRNKILFICKHYSKFHILKYILQYPILFTLTNLVKVLQKRTITQRVSIITNEKEALKRLIKIYLYSIIFFLITLAPALILCKKIYLKKRYIR